GTCREVDRYKIRIPHNVTPNPVNVRMEELRRYESKRQAAPAPNSTMLVPSVPLYCSRHNFFFNLRFSDSNCLSRALRALLSSGPCGDAESGLSPPSFPPPPSCSIRVLRLHRLCF